MRVENYKLQVLTCGSYAHVPHVCSEWGNVGCGENGCFTPTFPTSVYIDVGNVGEAILSKRETLPVKICKERKGG